MPALHRWNSQAPPATRHAGWGRRGNASRPDMTSRGLTLYAVRNRDAFDTTDTLANVDSKTRGLEIADDLRPDRDHADEQRQSGERSGLLNDDFEHRTLQRT